MLVLLIRRKVECCTRRGRVARSLRNRARRPRRRASRHYQRAEHGIHLMNLDDAPGPRMPRIENLAIFDPVGVPLSRSTTESDRIRALTPERRIAPTSTTCRKLRQHESRRCFRGVTPVGLRPPCVPPRKQHTITATGRGSTYPAAKPVQTKPATSRCAPHSVEHQWWGPLSKAKKHALLPPASVMEIAAFWRKRSCRTQRKSSPGPCQNRQSCRAQSRSQ